MQVRYILINLSHCHRGKLIHTSAHHLHLADHIIVLSQDGHIVKQGSYQTLFGKQKEVEYMMNSGKAPSTTKAAVSVQPISPAPKGPSADDRANATRQIGDGSLYKLYIASLGWSLNAVIFVMTIIYAFAYYFQRKLSFINQRSG